MLAEYHSFVNPYRAIPSFVQHLTGIRPNDVNKAPPFGVVAGELSEFLGDSPIVGHSIGFDLEFLASHGLPLRNQTLDTYDLALIFLPSSAEYSLQFLLTQLAVKHPQPHRALADAHGAYQLFLSLLNVANSLGYAPLSFMENLATQIQWPLGNLFSTLPALHKRSPDNIDPPQTLDIDRLTEHLHTRPKVSSDHNLPFLDESTLVNYLSHHGLLQNTFPNFEYRPEQIDILRSVVKILNQGGQAIIEGGTGIGKSLSYLLPSILYSVKSATPLVISTNTINLQEQLLKKDIPTLVNILEGAGILAHEAFLATPLKGRNNYLCLRRWEHLSRTTGLSTDEVRLLSKTLVWLQETVTGDRGEINLSGKDGLIWDRISAGNREWCPGNVHGACFLKMARERAHGANIIVVNHALLLADLKTGGGILPEYKHLIVDEAHNLEEEATNQFGLQVKQGQVFEILDKLQRVISNMGPVIGLAFENAGQKATGNKLLANIDRGLSSVRDNWGRLCDALERSLSSNNSGSKSDRSRLRVTSTIRVHPNWNDVVVARENFDVTLSAILGPITELHYLISTAPARQPVDLSTILAELPQWQEEAIELNDQLRDMLSGPLSDDRIVWISQDERTTNLTIQSAPLNVGQELQEKLYHNKDSVILTSATLTTEGSYKYIKDRLGFSEANELTVGSPFNYRQSALVLLPNDIPPPTAAGYKESLDSAITSLGTALNGHTLVLFTSHASLRNTAQSIREPLKNLDVEVLAQGIDGSPARLCRRFLENPQSVLLGTSSFWEGVDLPGSALQSLVLVRLPFNVPTEPVFSARSELFGDPFYEYALPQSILRFRQGFGRLIRHKNDRGIITIMDRRIVDRPYGKAFIQSLPECTVKQVALSSIAYEAREWLTD